MGESRGFVYVVNTTKYLEESLKSYETLRRHMPNASVAIVTHARLFRDIPGVTWVDLVGNYDSPMVKFEAFRCSFDRFIFLDSDTRIVRDITLLFDVLDGFDCALAHEPMRGWYYPTEAARVFCELNTGVMVVRKSERTQRLFQRWIDTYKRMRVELNIINDQAAFREALWFSSDVRHCTLPSEFHLITGKPSILTWHAHILHGRNNLPTLEVELNRTIGPRAFIPAFGTVTSYSGRRSLLKNWLRLSLRTLAVLARPARLSTEDSPGDWDVREQAQLVGGVAKKSLSEGGASTISAVVKL